MSVGPHARLVVRVVVATVVVTSLVFVGSAYATRHETVAGPTETTTVGETVASERPNATVITTQGSIPEVELPRSAIRGLNGGIFLIGPSGELLYKNGTYHAYFDVDPVPATRATVSYVAFEFVPADECNTTHHCYVRHVERLNVTTGEVKTIYSEVNAEPAAGTGNNEGRWHDVDRDGPQTLLVADIKTDSVRLLNTTTGLTEWEWRAAPDLAASSGGSFEDDWTHINDVERLPDGRVMASLRNQDMIVFVDPETGLQASWTLGADDAHGIMNEQHNPDYVPASRGGPAVIVADSRNDRIVEYQRENGEWVTSWVWQDTAMYWPRDADRLPNGHTLITDTTADRVIEVDESGEIVWSVTLDRPYEAERLGTGDESAGGESAVRLGLPSRTATESTAGGFKSILNTLLPQPVKDAVAFFMPPWMGFFHIGATLGTIGTLAVWLPLEFRWSSLSLRVRRPIRLSRER